MNQERLMRVLLAPHVSEKANLCSEANNTVVFKVLRDAEKHEIKTAVEKLFDVKVERVTTVNVKGKVKGAGLRKGRRSDWKKAYIKLAEGYAISVFGEQA
ncbi:MAG TPA: 50S ribosomal protein L23 [Permianibacter sp.]|nr:50S ribosomal protein L23 [Permianibacter sp.]